MILSQVIHSDTMNLWWSKVSTQGTDLRMVTVSSKFGASISSILEMTSDAILVLRVLKPTSSTLTTFGVDQLSPTLSAEQCHFQFL